MRLDSRKEIWSLKSAWSILHEFKAHVLLPLEGNTSGRKKSRPISDSAAVTFLLIMLAVANALLKSVLLISFKILDNNHTIVEMLQLHAKFQTAMVSGSRFIWIISSSYHKRIWTVNLLHTKYLPNPLGQIPVTTGVFELWTSCIRSSYLTHR